MSLPTASAVHLSGGPTIPYIEHGDPDGIPLVLLHGVTDSHRSFEPSLAALPDSIHAYAITQRGHGDASKPATGYAAADFAADVVGFMDAVGIDRAVIAGHSMGSWVARHVAATYPERVLGLVLAGCFPPVGVDFGELLEDFRTLGDPVDPGYARAWQESTLARPIPEWFMEMVVDETCKVPPHVWSAPLDAMQHDSLDSAKKISAPTLLLYGERDDFIPREGQDVLLAAIPDSSLIVYEGGGHALHWERPDRYAADVVAFVAALVQAG